MEKKINIKWNPDIVDVPDEVELGEIEVFIIPNHAAFSKNYVLMNTNALEQRMKRFAEVNGETYDPDKDYLIQIWMVSEDLDCSNCQDHYPAIIDKRRPEENVEYWLRFPYHIPESLAVKLHEGESVDFVIPVIVNKCIFVNKYIGVKRDKAYNEHEIEALIKCKLTPAQTKYRYKGFGTWEECLKAVI